MLRRAGLLEPWRVRITVVRRSPGDMAGAVAWMVDNAKTLSGGDLSKFLDPAGAAPTAGSFYASGWVET